MECEMERGFCTATEKPQDFPGRAVKCWGGRDVWDALLILLPLLPRRAENNGQIGFVKIQQTLKLSLGY